VYYSDIIRRKKIVYSPYLLAAAIKIW